MLSDDIRECLDGNAKDAIFVVEVKTVLERCLKVVQAVENLLPAQSGDSTLKGVGHG